MFKKIQNYFIYKKQKQFAKLFKLSPNSYFLDISCGIGNELNIIKKFNPQLNTFGIDISKESISMAKNIFPNISFQIADAHSLPFKENYFNHLFSSMTFHHYQNPDQIFKEAYRVLKTNGHFYILDLIPLTGLSQWFLNKDKCPEKYFFKKYYTKKELLNIAQKYQFQLKNVKTIDILNGIKFLTFSKLT